jgi:DNA replication protein DnaC
MMNDYMMNDIVVTERLPDLDNDEIKVIDDYTMDIPRNLPQGFFSLLAVGSSGSGKTNAVINLVQRLKSYYKVFILISPTGCIDLERGKRGEKKYNKLN